MDPTPAGTAATPVKTPHVLIAGAGPVGLVSAHASQIVKQLTPMHGEPVLRKTSASAIFSTGLSEWLRLRGVDTAVIVGCTTNGCVRATVVDAMQFNFRTIVVEDCVGDRAIGPPTCRWSALRQRLSCFWASR